MDTRSRKSTKLAKIIIILAVILPALFLTVIYPSVKSEMLRIEKEYDEQVIENDMELELAESIINYAMEASYYLYSQSLINETGQQIDLSVLEHYGWINDYYYLMDQTDCQYVFTHGDGRIVGGDDVSNSNKYVATLQLSFDSFGNLGELEFQGDNFYPIDTGYLRERASESTLQYLDNVSVYETEFETSINEREVVPKNFDLTLYIMDTSIFVNNYNNYLYISTESLLMETGVIWLIIFMTVLVALVALLLPFAKKLQTGWEKVFCLPFEFILCFAAASIGGAVGLCYLMGEVGRISDYPVINIVGIPVSSHVQYGALLGLVFAGWVLTFFCEYVTVAALRQFLCGPINYFKNRLLIMVFIRWFKNKVVKVCKEISQMNVAENVKKMILKVTAVNFATVFVVSFVLSMCAFRYAFERNLLLGLAIGTLYSALLYIVLLKISGKVLKQYNSILNTTSQMADGNLKIQLEEDLGVFKPIGDSLEKVQQGFEKAVLEEAKSQNMKTELITNVSHDLKTPLTAIITYVDLLKKEDLTEAERKSYINTLDVKSQRLKVLIEDLFEVSKAQSGNVTMNFMDVDVVSLLKQVKSEMDDQIQNSGLEFRWNLPKEKVVLPLDGQRTYRVFENLINNAIKYSMPFSRVYVDMLEKEDELKIVFRNISAQELNFEAERLTERFVRGDVSRKSEGSGLGLAIAKSFVELQNGTFEIEIDGDLFKVIITWQQKKAS